MPEKHKKLKKWINISMALYVITLVIGVGLNLSNTVSKAEQLDTYFNSETVESSEIQSESSEIQSKSSEIQSESSEIQSESSEVKESTVETTYSEDEKEESINQEQVTTKKESETSTKVSSVTSESVEETTPITKQVSRTTEVTTLEDLLETTYNPSNYEEDHTEECSEWASQYPSDTFCEGFYKLIAKTASEKALNAYMLDYQVYSYFGVDSSDNTLNANVTAYLSDGSVATSTDTAIYREFNGKKTKLLDLSNNPNYYYFENGLYISNKGIISGTTISKSTKTLTIPNKISGITVKGIDSAVFRDYNFTSVSLPDSIEIIGYEQFYNSTFKTFKKPKNLKYTAHNMFNPELSVTIS